VGFIANSCVEATGRYGMELGYHVTLVEDAILSTDELLVALPQPTLSSQV
jgi:nicotinamidase-related amidase